MPDPEPLIFEPILLPKVWGGHRLARFGKTIAPGQRIGESWELADLAHTAASGAGGGEARSRVRRGAMMGLTLSEVVEALGDRLIDRGLLGPGPEFPLLVKYLDASEHLSVQVHPSPAYAGSHPGAHLKTECWYVLEAEPGAAIYKGLREGVGRAELADAIDTGCVAEVLCSVPAVAGECHLLPSGTVHALGAGVLVAEVQSPSDTTFRLYDWEAEYGRSGREMHIEQGLDAAVFDPPPARSCLGDRERARLVDTELFSLDAARVHADGDLVLWDEPGPAIVMAVEIAIELEWEQCGGGRVSMELGETALVPSAIARGVRARADREGVVLLAGLGGA